MRGYICTDSYHGKVFSIIYNKDFFDLKKVLKNEKFDIVHIHSDVAFKIFIEALACRIAGQKIIVLHSHCTGVDGDHRAIKSLAHHICKPFLGLLGTDFFACSQKAGDWMYTKKINQKKLHVINNAIDCEAFASQIAEKQEIIASLNTGEYSRSDPMKYRFMLFCCFAMCWEYGSATCLMLLRPQRFLNHEYST